MRFAVPLALVGVFVVVILAVVITPLRVVLTTPSFPRLVCALYCTAGVQRCKGHVFALAFLLACTLDFACEVHVISPIVGFMGYLCVAMPPCAQVVAWIVWYVCPQWIDDAQEDRLRVLCRAVDAGYDIICFQEVTVFWGLDSIADDIKSACNKHGLVHFCSSGRWPTWPSLFATTGLCVSSRFPITRIKPVPFSQQSWFEWYIIQRGALLVEISLPDGKTVAIANVHTTAGVEVLESGIGRRPDEQRANPLGLRQLLEVMDIFAEFSKSSSQKIFCGDFNLTKDSVDFQFLKQRAAEMGLSDCFPLSPPTFGCLDEPREKLLTKLADQNIPKVLDHVFSDRACSSARVESLAAPRELWHRFQQVSDHRAVEVSWS